MPGPATQRAPDSPEIFAMALGSPLAEAVARTHSTAYFS
jgi:hypothetical protein